MRRGVVGSAALVALLGCAPLPVAPTAADDRPREPSPSARAAAGGWSYLVDKLVADGLPRDAVVAAFGDPRMPPFTGLEYALAPRESHALYRQFLAPGSIASARRCRGENAVALDAAERARGVPASLVAAVLHVETGCGRNTGSQVILHRLARLAMANEPRNLERNLGRFAAGSGGLDPTTEARARERALYLEDTFYPEVRATFEVAQRLGVDPLTLRGSSAGAMGTPQFLPTRYLRHGSDGNGDGRVDLFDTADAAASCATYLADEGWRPGLSAPERRAVIWQYNHSDAYIDAVLALARAIDGEATPAVRPASAPAPRARRAGSRRASLRKG